MIVTPDQRVRVFVSSTLGELAEERATARTAIQNLHLTPVMFEIAARAHPPRELYRAYLEQSDVFIGIYGERYGWVAPDMEISGLEDEWRLAAGKPRLVYVKQPAPNRDPLLQGLVDGIEAEAALSYRKFSNAAELGRLIEDDLALLLSERFAGPPRIARRRLPAPVDRFIGRAEELTRLERLLLDAHIRLVTVTGPGGVGKTRLALEAARNVRPRLTGEVVFVPLASVANPELVAAAIKESLAAPGAGAPIDTVTRALNDRELLLVLDNFEHVLAAAPDVGRLLEQSPGLHVLVTSRAVLRLRGEHELALRPLDPRTEAVDLFLDRARALAAPVELDRPVIAELCDRLEGMPLAVEIAVGQLRLLSPAAILARLDRVSSSLHATIDWSFDLLTADEQRAFVHASVFRGGFTLEAFEAVCARDGDPVGLLGSLVEKSLVARQTAEEEPRYAMLEAIREYAANRLAADPDAVQVRDRHARFYLDLVAAVSGVLRSRAHATGLARLDRELQNVRSALDWELERRRGDSVAAAAWALVPYWAFREQLIEGRRWLDTLLEQGDLTPESRARALAVNGFLRSWHGDYAAAEPVSREALALATTLNDEQAVALAEVVLGVLGCIVGNPAVALPLLERARDRCERAGDEWGVSMAVLGIAWGLNLAERPAEIEFYQQALAQARLLGYEAEALALGALGRRHSLRGEYPAARRVVADVLRRVHAIGVPLGIAVYLDLLADIAAAEGEDRLATRLSEAAAGIVESFGAPFPALAGERRPRLDRLRERLGTETYDAESQQGRALSLDEVVDEAISWATGSPS